MAAGRGKVPGMGKHGRQLLRRPAFVCIIFSCIFCSLYIFFNDFFFVGPLWRSFKGAACSTRRITAHLSKWQRRKGVVQEEEKTCWGHVALLLAGCGFGVSQSGSIIALGRHRPTGSSQLAWVRLLGQTNEKRLAILKHANFSSVRNLISKCRFNERKLLSLPQNGVSPVLVLCIVLYTFLFLQLFLLLFPFSLSLFLLLKA